MTLLRIPLLTSNLVLDTKVECNMSTGASVLFCDNELMFISKQKIKVFT